MSFASGSGVRVAYVAEVTPGTTPATPSFKTFRATNGGMRTNKTVVTSDERQADRNVRDEILTGLGVSGSFDFEFTSDTLDDLLEGALCGSWATNVLKNGIAQKYFTVEETYELGATDTFRRFSGSRVNTMSLSMAAREKVTGSVALMGMQEALATAIVTGATYAAPSTTQVATASSNVASLAVGALSPQPKVRSLSLEMNNGLRERPVIGSMYTQEFGEGRFECTGTMACYFESNALYQAVLNHETAALSFNLGVEANKKYTFLLPKIRFGDGEVTAGGNDDDVMANIPFRALLDTTEACSLKITRAVA